MYLELRRRRWFAFHDIPADVHHVLGKTRFSTSLETGDRRIAERRAAVIKARWLSEIEKARRGSSDHVEKDAEFWRRAYRDADPAQRQVVLDVLGDELDAKTYTAAARAGFTDASQPGFDELPERQEANRVFGIVTGALVKLDAHLSEYIATLRNNEAKTRDMKAATIKKFAETFPYVSDVHRKGVQRWVNGQVQEGKAVATVRRSLSELRGYWTYLQSIEAVSDDVLPFDKLTVPRAGKSGAGDDRLPFEAGDVVKLLRAAEDDGDADLADLIRLAMWTGARIEELAALPVTKVRGDHFEVEDAKTAAGCRAVPIHSKLAATIERLTKDRVDGYLLANLQPNKYGDRSGAIGKRFGRLKKAQGFGARHVFHSIRKTVATLLDNAGVAENVAADILGHDHPTLTYGLYSGGSTLATKVKALAKLKYPGM